MQLIETRRKSLELTCTRPKNNNNSGLPEMTNVPSSVRW